MFFCNSPPRNIASHFVSDVEEAPVLTTATLGIVRYFPPPLVRYFPDLCCDLVRSGSTDIVNTINRRGQNNTHLTARWSDALQ